jgi:hypothetical protein
MKSVDNGAALLDERLPGWRAYVDADTLTLASGCDCVLGQLFGSYYKGLAVLDIDDPARFGFYKPSRTTWERLTEAWRKVLA